MSTDNKYAHAEHYDALLDNTHTLININVDDSRHVFLVPTKLISLSDIELVESCKCKSDEVLVTSSSSSEDKKCFNLFFGQSAKFRRYEFFESETMYCLITKIYFITTKGS